MNLERWRASIDWPPGTLDAVTQELFAAFVKKRHLWVTYGDPHTGKHQCELTDCVVGMVTFEGRRCLIDGEDAMAQYIVAIGGGFQPGLTTKPTTVFYKHPNLRFDRSFGDKTPVMIEDAPEANGLRWAVVRAGFQIAKFKKSDSAVRLVTALGLALHTLEDLYGGDL